MPASIRRFHCSKDFQNKLQVHNHPVIECSVFPAVSKVYQFKQVLTKITNITIEMVDNLQVTYIELTGMMWRKGYISN